MRTTVNTCSRCGLAADSHDPGVLASGLDHVGCRFPVLASRLLPAVARDPGSITASATIGVDFAATAAAARRLTDRVVALADARRALRRLERASR